MSIFPRPLKRVLDKIIPFSQEDKIPTFNLGTGTADNTTYLRGDGTWATVSGGGGMMSGTATAAVTDIYTTTISGVSSYTTNDSYIIKFNTANVNGATLNINGIGAVNLVKNNDVTITGGDIRVGQEFLVVYDGTNFQMIGIAPNQMFAYVTNDDSVTINKGQVVYAFSAAGDRMSVKLAYNTSDATSAKTVGIVFSSSIAPNGTGFIITQGVIQNLNTAAYSAGDTLYLGATAGTVTNVKPYAPNHLVYVGIVERANAGNGQIYVRVQNGYELDEIHDVDLVTTPPVNGDVLTYNGSLWVNQAPSGGTVTSVATSAPITGGTITGSGTIGITQATTSTDGYISSTDWNTFNGKQDLLVSGTNIKTINSISLLGSGNITISSGITIGTTAITSGTSTRILFENGSNVVSQSAKLTFNSSTNEFQAGFRVIAGTNGMTDTGGALHVYAGNANDFVSRWFNTSGINIMTLRTTGNGGRLALCNSTGQEGIILNGIFSDALTFGAGRDIYFDTATGTKIGASTSQKFAFWNKTPIVQPTTAVGSATRAGSGGTNLTTNTTFDGYTLAQVVLALRNIGLLA
jgi:hypothetical protein